jgi:hypothetical protein
MHNEYQDIVSRIAEPPTWYDEHGVPRWGAFTARGVANIYWEECALLLIACQNCRREFRVCISSGALDRLQHGPLADVVRDGSIHYGDPPNMGCCPAGPTMNCLDLKVLEFWRRDSFVGVRVFELEVELPDASDPEFRN